MPTVNEKGLKKGKMYILGLMVFSRWKGMQTMRALAKSKTYKKSATQSVVTSGMASAANRFRDVITDSQRNAWDQYAGTLGSAVDRERSDNTAVAKSVIPKRKKLMSGINAYVGAYIDGKLAGKTDTMDIPPIGEHVPPPPMNVTINGAGVVSWYRPYLSRFAYI